MLIEVNAPKSHLLLDVAELLPQALEEWLDLDDAVAVDRVHVTLQHLLEHRVESRRRQAKVIRLENVVQLGHKYLVLALGVRLAHGILQLCVVEVQVRQVGVLQEVFVVDARVVTLEVLDEFCFLVFADLHVVLGEAADE